MSQVCFIAVSYFGSDDIELYIASLREQTDPRWTLKIVDNSQNETESQRLNHLAIQDSRIEVWSAAGNLGYFGAAEWARRRLGANKHLWTAVTNTDVALNTKRFVEDLISLDHLDAAVIAPAIYGSRSQSALNPYMLTRPTVARARLRRFLFSNTFTAQLTILASYARKKVFKQAKTEPTPAEIYAAHGCFMIFGRAFFAAGGTFVHQSFLFGEELTIGEFCRIRGLRTKYIPHLLVEHTEHATTGILRSRSVLKAQVTAAKNALDLLRTSDCITERCS